MSDSSDDEERSALITGPTTRAHDSSGRPLFACLLLFLVVLLVTVCVELPALRSTSSAKLQAEVKSLRNELKHLKANLAAVPPIIAVAPYRSILNESRTWVEYHAPHFECSDPDVSSSYWYRWRLFHLHMTRRPQRARGCGKPQGCWVLTEFLKKVWWAGAYGTIVCPASHHIMEGRWLRDPEIVDDYARFWFKGEGYRKQYVWWAAHALYQRSLLVGATPAQGVTAELFGDLDALYHDWLRTHYHPHARCMYTSCHADGQENSAGLDGCRPTINSVMYGEARALGLIAAALGNGSRASYFEAEADRWQKVLTSKLWSPELRFFVNEAQEPPALLCGHRQRDCPRGRRITTGCLGCDRKRTCPPPAGWPVGKRVPVRELMGLSSPWYFGAVPDDPVSTSRYAVAFEQLDDPQGFGAKWGPTTTERRSSCFNFTSREQCNWNGAVWPFEVAKVGTALINLLQAYPAQQTVDRRSFDGLLRQYARAHTRSTADGLPPPHVDEDLHPDDGYWITRRKLHGVRVWKGVGGVGRPHGKDPLANRGDHYFHSTFNDLVLSGLVGLRPQPTFLEVHPLTLVSSFAVTRLRLRNVDVSVVWDADGSRYAYGAGLFVWFDGVMVGSAQPQRLWGGVAAPTVLRVSWDKRSVLS